MSNILTIAYTTEGATDQRFLHNIIRKTFEESALNCKGLIEVYDPVFIKFEKNRGFVEDVMTLAGQAFKRGIKIFCIHADADSSTAVPILETKINPAFHAIQELNDVEVCKNLIAIIPVYMSEAWMLADKSLLKDEIGTEMSDQDLGLIRHPEAVADPKGMIEVALSIAQSELPKRRKRLTIAELYQPLGQKVSLDKLATLKSYNTFKISAEEALRKLNFLD